MKESIEIHYCPKCKWLARAAWYAQELLSTYGEDLDRVALVPSDDAGVFLIRIGEQNLMDRSVEGFLEAKILKRRVRDLIDPDRPLGHVDGLSERVDGFRPDS